MHIIATGLSHKTAPIEVREKVSFPEDRLPDALECLVGYPSVSESVILSTCNRTEIYSVVAGVEEGKADIIDFLCEYQDLKRNALEKYLYFHEGPSAVHHVFRVASSLDSMVVGEAQILGQVKEAYTSAYEAQATSAVLNKLFRHALQVGKRVRTETEIGESAVSISYAAVELAKRVFESLEGRTVLVVGAGEMSELTVKHLIANGVTKVLVTNRTFKRAKELADGLGGEAIKFDDIIESMARADILISSTASPDFVIDKSEVATVMHRRRNKPIFLIDIALPRDIDPEVGNLYNVFLYDIDDLQSVVQSNLAERARAAHLCEGIVEREVADFISWISTLEVVPTISTLKERAESIRLLELEKALKRFKDLSEDELSVLNALTTGIVNKLLHEPIVRLKECANQKDGYLYIESLRHLFDLESRLLQGGKTSEVPRSVKSLGTVADCPDGERHALDRQAEQRVSGGIEG
ncbi:MAG: glutamyl-tRNA reductase [Actinobacteria bacterium]|nr:glutamyl-tRNA reductase [Actinomycetota bacterium]